MAKYSYKCTTCATTIQRYASKDTKLSCEKCGTELRRQMPKGFSQEVTEVVDQLTGVTWKQDQEELLKERKEDYYWSVEVPRLVRQYSIETCIENGWVYVDDKGQMQVHTKPPGKR